jgi:hypothetical protein
VKLGCQLKWQVLKFFRTRSPFTQPAEASAEIGAVQAANGMQMVATTLTIDQVRDAEVCFRRLIGNTRPLSFYLEFALTNYRPADGSWFTSTNSGFQKTMSRAAKSVSAAVRRDRGKRGGFALPGLVPRIGGAAALALGRLRAQCG